MTISEQIIRAFTVADSRSLCIKADWGRVRISRRAYRDFFGTQRNSFKAELLEAGRTVECKTENPLTALAGLHAQVSNLKRGTK
jgi:hypothetical protein